MIRPVSMLIISILAGGMFLRPAHAEVKVIEADGTYVMGDNDSKLDARRIATQEAKRKALELAGTFVAGLTQVKEYKLTKDEVTAYTAGIVETEIVAEEMRGTSARPEIYLKTRCRIDTDVLVAQIERYRENEELQAQLQAAQKENETLRKERDALTASLSAEKDKTKADDIRKQLDTVLTREEAHDDVNRVWASFSRKVDFTDPASPTVSITQEELDRALTVVQRAAAVNPNDPRARLLLATIYQKKGNPAEAERALRTALEMQPANPLLHMRLAQLLKHQGRYDEALRELRFIELRRPNEPRMLFLTGMTHKANGNCRLAVMYLKRFMRYTKRNDRPFIMSMKDDAVQVLKECGDKPRGKAPGHGPARRP